MSIKIDKPYADRPTWQPLHTGEAQANINDEANAFAVWPEKKSADWPSTGTHALTGSCLLDTVQAQAGVNWKTALGRNPDDPEAVYYDGLTLRNASGKPLARIVEALEARIDGVLRAHGTAGAGNDGYCAGLSRQIRRTISADPTLSLHPPPDVIYGSPRWVALWTGMQTLAGQGISAHQRETDDLVAVGRAALRTRAGRNTVTPVAGATPGIDVGGLLLMAHAAGRIDLGGIAKGDATITPDALTAYCREAFNDELRIIDLLAELARLQLPTGSQVAQAGVGRPGGDAHDAVNTDTGIRADESALKSAFDAAFDAQATVIAAYVAAILDTSLSRYGKSHGVDVDQASISITGLQRRLPRNEPPPSSEPASVMPPNDGHGYVVSIDTPAGRHRYFFAFDTGTELPLPSDITVEDWARNNGKLLFGTDDPALGTLADTPAQTIEIKEIASGTRREIAEQVGKAVPASLEPARAAAFAHGNTDLAGEAVPGPAPFGSAHRAALGGYPYDISSAAALDMLILVPGIGNGVSRGELAGKALADEVERGFRLAGKAGILQSIRNANTTPADILSLLRGGGRLTAKGVRTMAQRLEPARPALARELSRTSGVSTAIATGAISTTTPRLDDAYGDAGADIRVTRIVDERAAAELDRQLPEATPNYRGTYDDSDPYAWSDDGEYQYTGFLADTKTVALAEGVLRNATDLTCYAWWKEEFDQFFDIQPPALEESASVQAETRLADASATAKTEQMQTGLQTFLAETYAKSETFRGLVNEARKSGRLTRYAKWTIHIVPPREISNGRSEYASPGAHVDFGSRTLSVPDVQAPPEGMDATTLAEGGTFIPNAAPAVIIHEMLHALTGHSDPSVDRWENNAAALLQGFPERGVVDYLAQRILRESGVKTPRRLCYLRFEAEHRDVVQRQMSAETIKALEDYIDMQDAYLSRVFASRDPDTAAFRSVNG